jgi:hypothetical protein
VQGLRAPTAGTVRVLGEDPRVHEPSLEDVFLKLSGHLVED